jgi:prepilin-type N-terminal cleavage/methylation domain-containing protein
VIILWVADKNIMRVKKGFTLIELLVVIAIIALLIAILIPILHSAHEQGQRAVCTANLRQLNLAWWTYAEENDGRIVPCWMIEDPNIPNRVQCEITWAYNRTFAVDPFEMRIEEGFLWPYLKSLKVYSCPASPNPRSLYHGSKVHYLVSRGLYVQIKGPRMERLVTFGHEFTHEIKQPGRRMIFFDLGTCKGHNVGPYFGYQTINIPKECWAHYDYPPLHHSNGTCLSFVDSHIEYWKWKDARTIKLGRDGPYNHWQGLYDEQPGNQDLARLDRAIFGIPENTP